MGNNMDVMLEFFLIRQSLAVHVHLPSVECGSLPYCARFCHKSE